MAATPTLGDMIRTRRKQLGLSQTELGSMVGRSQRWVSTIESGGAIGGLKTDLLCWTADALRLDADDLTLASGIARTRKAARARRIMAEFGERDRERLQEIHVQLDPRLVKMTPRHIEVLVQVADLLIDGADDLRPIG